MTHAQLIASWTAALDAAGEALGAAAEYDVYSPMEVVDRRRRLRFERRWLNAFADIRRFP